MLNQHDFCLSRVTSARALVVVSVCHKVDRVLWRRWKHTAQVQWVDGVADGSKGGSLFYKLEQRIKNVNWSPESVSDRVLQVGP